LNGKYRPFFPQPPVLTDYDTFFLPFNPSGNMKLYTIFTSP